MNEMNLFIYFINYLFIYLYLNDIISQQIVFDKTHENYIYISLSVYCFGDEPITYYIHKLNLFIIIYKKNSQDNF